MSGMSGNKRRNSGERSAGIPSGNRQRIPRSRFEEPSAAIRLLSRERVIENSKLASLSPFFFSKRAMFSSRQRFQSVFVVDTFARPHKRVTASGRQSTASMSFSAHSSQVPARLFQVRFAASRGKLISGGNLGRVHVVPFGLSVPRIVMRTVTVDNAVICASRLSTALFPGPCWSQGDSNVSRQRIHFLDPREESTRGSSELSTVVPGWRRENE